MKWFLDDGLVDELEESRRVLFRFHGGNPVHASSKFDRLGHLGGLLLDPIVRQDINQRCKCKKESFVDRHAAHFILLKMSTNLWSRSLACPLTVWRRCLSLDQWSDRWEEHNSHELGLEANLAASMPIPSHPNHTPRRRLQLKNKQFSMIAYSWMPCHSIPYRPLHLLLVGYPFQPVSGCERRGEESSP